MSRWCAFPIVSVFSPPCVNKLTTIKGTIIPATVEAVTDSFPSLPQGWLSPLFLITAVACFMQCTRIFFYEGDMSDGLSCVQILPVLTAWYKALKLCPLHSSSGGMQSEIM